MWSLSILDRPHKDWAGRPAWQLLHLEMWDGNSCSVAEINVILPVSRDLQTRWAERMIR